MGLRGLSGRETPAQALALAYGLEKGLRTFYLTLAEESTASKLAALFTRLAGIELRHLDRLRQLAERLTPEPGRNQSLEARAGEMMEGGISTAEFLAAHREALETPAEVLDLALSLETQALDHYLRFADLSRDQAARAVLLDIAQQEKEHLAALGRLREENP